ncbi:hypothetical protein [Oryzihumus leptocrescens]|nr:hypothetical protein [Oryzihumus leptocrescens]
MSISTAGEAHAGQVIPGGHLDYYQAVEVSSYSNAIDLDRRIGACSTSPGGSCTITHGESLSTTVGTALGMTKYDVSAEIKVDITASNSTDVSCSSPVFGNNHGKQWVAHDRGVRKYYRLQHVTRVNYGYPTHYVTSGVLTAFQPYRSQIFCRFE